MRFSAHMKTTHQTSVFITSQPHRSLCPQSRVFGWPRASCHINRTLRGGPLQARSFLTSGTKHRWTQSEKVLGVRALYNQDWQLVVCPLRGWGPACSCAHCLAGVWHGRALGCPELFRRTSFPVISRVSGNYQHLSVVLRPPFAFSLAFAAHLPFAWSRNALAFPTPGSVGDLEQSCTHRELQSCLQFRVKGSFAGGAGLVCLLAELWQGLPSETLSGPHGKQSQL